MSMVKNIIDVKNEMERGSFMVFVVSIVLNLAQEFATRSLCMCRNTKQTIYDHSIAKCSVDDVLL